MQPDDEARARQLFFEYDGSEFYMSRDGADDEYLAALDRPGNWKIVDFLAHHWDYSHVKELLSTVPRGAWWERVAYLEGLMDYVRKARWLLRASGSDRAAAARIAIKYGEPILIEAADQEDTDLPTDTTEERRRRVEDLLREARRHAK
jgi:hypothetical protein